MPQYAFGRAFLKHILLVLIYSRQSLLNFFAFAALCSPGQLKLARRLAYILLHRIYLEWRTIPDQSLENKYMYVSISATWEWHSVKVARVYCRIWVANESLGNPVFRTIHSPLHIQRRQASGLKHSVSWNEIGFIRKRAKKRWINCVFDVWKNMLALYDGRQGLCRSTQ